MFRLRRLVEPGVTPRAARHTAVAVDSLTARNRQLEPCYKQHTAVDEVRGVVLDVAVTTGEVNEVDTIETQVDEVHKITWCEIATVTDDAGYAYAKVYGGLRVVGSTS